MADDEMPIAPAMTNASLAPQPRANPKAMPPPTFRTQVDGTDAEEPSTPFDQVAERELEAEVEQQHDEPERGEQLEVLGMVDERDAGRVRARR